MQLRKIRKDEGVAGLNLLLSVAVMLFIIGFLVMIFSVMGGELTDSIEEDVTTNATAVDVINDTVQELADIVDWFGIIIIITAMVVLILLTVVIIQAIRGTGYMTGSS